MDLKTPKSTISIFFVAALFVSTTCHAEAIKKTKAPKGAKAYIISPKDGAKLKSPVKVVFGLSGMGVAPAGVKSPSTGHHHLIIDDSLPKEGQPIPANENYKHFGKGQTETTIELKPGVHTLQIVLGDHIHVPHEPMIHSEKISITVE
jgi:hypothetical protein